LDVRHIKQIYIRKSDSRNATKRLGYKIQYMNIILSVPRFNLCNIYHDDNNDNNYYLLLFRP